MVIVFELCKKKKRGRERKEQRTTHLWLATSFNNYTRHKNGDIVFTLLKHVIGGGKEFDMAND